jgi:uncharacterized protein (DUF433 family)
MIEMPAVIEVPIETDSYGTIRVRGSRVTLASLVYCDRQGDSPERIHQGFPTVPLDTIYAVIAYYHTHREEVDSYIATMEVEAEAWRQQYEAENPQGQAFNERVKALLEARRKSHNGQA